MLFYWFVSISIYLSFPFHYLFTKQNKTKQNKTKQNKTKKIGHFSVLVGFVDPEAPDLLSFPLCDEKLIPLPVHFLEGEGEEEKKEEGKEAEGGEGEGRKDVFKVGGGSRRRIEALKKYVRNYQVVEMEREGGKGEKVLVEVCDQLHPLGEWVPVGESPVYFDSFEGMRENLCQLLNPGIFFFFFFFLFIFLSIHFIIHLLIFLPPPLSPSSFQTITACL